MNTYLKRLHLLVVKLISVKGLALILATVFLWEGIISDTTWWLSVTAITAARAVEKSNRTKGG